MKRWMTDLALAGICGERGRRSLWERPASWAAEFSRHNRYESAAPQMPLDMRWKKPRRCMAVGASNSFSGCLDIAHLSIDVQKASRIHERMTISCQRLATGQVPVTSIDTDQISLPLLREFAERVEPDSLLLVAGQAGERDQISPLDVLGRLRARLSANPFGKLFGQLMHHAI